MKADRRRHRGGGIAVVTPQNRVTHARAVRKGSSAANGTLTANSDLDITGAPGRAAAPFDESVVEAKWPVELLVPIEASLLPACEQDQGGAEPTTIGTVPPRWILLMIECQDKLLTGPGDRGHSESRAINYRLEGQP